MKGKAPIEKLEERFEKLLVETKNTELILAYTDLKIELGRILKEANKAIQTLESKVF